jgi:putative redox protein
VTPPPQTPAPAAGTHRQVELTRTGPLRLRATNVRGGTLDLSSGDDGSPDFTPVELLLVALAGCSAVDIESITGKRADPVRFDVTAGAEKVRDGNGNHLADVTLDFDVEFPDTEGGAKAEGVLRRAVEMTIDRLCTVSRTVELATPVRPRLRGVDVGGEGVGGGDVRDEERGAGGTDAS